MCCHGTRTRLQSQNRRITSLGPSNKTCCFVLCYWEACQPNGSSFFCFWPPTKKKNGKPLQKHSDTKTLSLSIKFLRIQLVFLALECQLGQRKSSNHTITLWVLVDQNYSPWFIPVNLLLDLAAKILWKRSLGVGIKLGHGWGETKSAIFYNAKNCSWGWAFPNFGSRTNQREPNEPKSNT